MGFRKGTRQAREAGRRGRRVKGARQAHAAIRASGRVPGAEARDARWDCSTADRTAKGKRTITGELGTAEQKERDRETIAIYSLPSERVVTICADDHDPCSFHHANQGRPIRELSPRELAENERILRDAQQRTEVELEARRKRQQHLDGPYNRGGITLSALYGF